MARPAAWDVDARCSSGLLLIGDRDLLGVRARGGLGEQRVLRERSLGDGGGPPMVIDRSEELVEHEREVRLVAAVERDRNGDLVARRAGLFDLDAWKF